MPILRVTTPSLDFARLSVFSETPLALASDLMVETCSGIRLKAMSMSPRRIESSCAALSPMWRMMMRSSGGLPRQ